MPTSAASQPISSLPVTRSGRAFAAMVAGLISLHLGGCATQPKLLPKNEISEPVFHTTRFMGLGASIGPGWERVPGTDSHERVLNFAPRGYLDVNVSRWASFSLWPVFWNLLLTGEQYADGGELKIRKLHLCLHGGVSGLAFSSRDGLQAAGSAQLSAKYLIARTWFVTAVSGRRLYDLEDMAHGINFAAADLGTQLSPRNSLRFTYGLEQYDIPGDMRFHAGEIDYHDGDIRTKLALRHSFYAALNHAFGPEAGMSFRNAGFVDGYSLGIGLHYRYLFD